jgi:hypothetical protein
MASWNRPQASGRTAGEPASRDGNDGSGARESALWPPPSKSSACQSTVRAFRSEAPRFDWSSAESLKPLPFAATLVRLSQPGHARSWSPQIGCCNDGVCGHQCILQKMSIDFLRCTPAVGTNAAFKLQASARPAGSSQIDSYTTCPQQQGAHLARRRTVQSASEYVRLLGCSGHWLSDLESGRLRLAAGVSASNSFPLPARR